MRLGLVGLGRFCVQQHTPSLLRYVEEGGALDLVLCDPTAAAREAWCAKFGARECFESDVRLIAEGKIDAAYVLVPPVACCETVSRFLEAGIPTFTEKPPGVVAAETRRLIQAAGTTPHAVGFNRRFSPVLRRLKDWVDEELAGEPLMFACDFWRAGRFDTDFATTLIHGVDALRFLGGDLASLEVRTQTVGGEKSFRNLLLHGAYASGALVQMSIQPACGLAVERYRAVGRDVTLSAQLPMPGLADQGLLTLERGGQVERRLTEADLGIADAPYFVRYGFYDQARTFLDGLQSGGALGTPLAATLQSVELMEFLRSAPDAAISCQLSGAGVSRRS